MARNNKYEDSISCFLFDFISAGSSALILSFFYIHIDLGFSYAVALLPVLLRAINTDIRGAATCGFLLSICLSFVISSRGVLESPLNYVTIIILLSSSFIVFTVTINRLKKYFLMSFLLFIALGLSLEHIHKSFFKFQNVFYSIKGNTGFAFRSITLFGIVILSFFAIAVNSILLILLGILRKKLVSRKYICAFRESLFFSGSNEKALLKHIECLPSLRAPPLFN